MQNKIKALLNEDVVMAVLGVGLLAEWVMFIHYIWSWS